MLRLAAAATVALLVIGASGVSGRAQDSQWAPSGGWQADALEYASPVYLPPEERKAREETPGQDEAYGRQTGLSNGMPMRRGTPPGMDIQPMSPEALLAIRGRLKLSDEQAERLRAIAENARRQAAQVLNEGQRETAGSLRGAFDSMAGMCRYRQQQGMTGPDGGSMYTGRTGGGAGDSRPQGR